jgi:hypothetical protein
MDADSYLKTGSNELRVLEYKVSKIVSDLVNFTKLPDAHPAIAGIF